MTQELLENLEMFALIGVIYAPPLIWWAYANFARK